MRVCTLNVRDENPYTAEIEKLGIPVDHVPVQKLRYVRQAWRLLLYLRNQRPDLVHTQLEFSNILAPAPVAARARPSA